jgi:hypothetical protein
LAALGQERCDRFSSGTRAGMRRLVRIADARPAFVARKTCDGWWAFLDTYRTLCLAPSPEIRDIF